jgi:LacI family repressor for deo operon, udp, cdd, tsx, nupC, and nupG
LSVQLTKKSLTIQDVARVAAVSTATVSRALSQPEKVSAATKLRVEEAVRLTGYTINQPARSLRSREARTILVALPDIGNTFFAAILDSIECEARLRGYGVLVTNRIAGPAAGRGLRDYFVSNRADGLLLFDGAFDLEQLLALGGDAGSVPLVVACEDIAGSPFHTIKTDNAYAAERATRHLIELGHDSIGHIRGPRGNVLRGEREQGFAAALRKAGIPLCTEWLLEGDFSMDGGLAAAEAFLALPHRPTAVFAANDDTAIGFLSGLRRGGVHCPDDISVIGFDDLAVARHLMPSLTTMRQPCAALGRLAAEALIDIIEGEPGRRVPRHMVLSSDLIVRGSTAPRLRQARTEEGKAGFLSAKIG